MSFSFDFSDDGEDDDGDDGADQKMRDASHIEAHNQPLSLPAGAASMRDGDRGSNRKTAKEENLTDLLSSLPSRISYSTLLVTSPNRKRQILIPRRALFDVKIQIMAESNDFGNSHGTENPIRSMEASSSPQFPGSNTQTTPSTSIAAGLGASDIEQDVYEGGFKSWEGAIDVAQLLLDQQEDEDMGSYASIIELGCGTAIPSLVFFQHALATNLALNFTCADYNDSVLRLVTLPNFILTWALLHSKESFSPQPPTLLSSLSPPAIHDAEGDLEITPALLEAFSSDLARRKISLYFVSGPWSASPEFTSLVTQDPSKKHLILAAETIYSSVALQSFTAALLAILRSVKHGNAIVAAKRMYFGVGGSVDEFVRAVAQAGGLVAEIEDSGIAGCDRSLIERAGGVGRWLGAVRLP